MSDTSEILLHIHELLKEKDQDAVGEMQLNPESLQLMNGSATVTAEILHDEGQHRSMVHCHLTTRLTGDFDTNLDACVVGIDPVHEMALFDVSRVWVDLVAGPVLSLLNDRAVMDAVQFDGSQSFGVQGCQGFVGPIGYRFVDISEDAEHEAAPFFDFADSISPPGLVHLAKATLDGVNRKQWRHTIEINGHEARHSEIARQGISIHPHGGIAIRFAAFHYADQPDAIEERCELDDAIQRYIELHEYDDTTEVDARFIDESKSADQARRIIAFAPGACARLAFASQVRGWPSSYAIASRGASKRDDIKEKDLLSVAEYARTLVRAEALAQKYPDRFRRVVEKSSELNAINDLMHRGSKMEDIDVLPAVIPDADATEADIQYTLELMSERHAKRNRKPWWKFW